MIQEKKDMDQLHLDTIEEMLQGFARMEMPKESELKKCHRLQEEWKNLLKMS